MNREETKEAIKVMQHFADGGAIVIKIRAAHIDNEYTDDNPNWNWGFFDYFIEKTTKKVKLYAHLDAYGLLFWCTGELVAYKRVSSEDKIVEVEE